MAMKNNRKSLDKAAAELRAKYGMKADVCNADIFAKNIFAEFDRFVEFVKDHAADDEAVKAAKAPVNKALALYHDEMRMQRLEQLAAMPSAEADLEYLRTQCVNGYKLVSDKDGNWSIVDSRTDSDGNVTPVCVGLSAYDYVNYVHPTEMNGIKNACVIFAENVCKSEFGKDAGISRKAISQQYIDLRTRMGWCIDGKASNTKLAEQLTEIFHFMMRGVEFEAKNADVKFVRSTIISGIDKPDQAGAYMLRNEETIINTVFRAGYTRINNLPYGFQNKTNSEKTPFGMAAEKVHEDIKSKKVDEPVVTAETVVFAEDDQQ